MNTEFIEKRYDNLAEQTCCLSCGGAINHSEAKEGDICIDLGCGQGSDVIRLAEKVGEMGFVYGLDISEKMISKATSNAEKLDVKNVKFIRTELRTLPLNSGLANLIISNCTINHVQDKQTIWNEIYRVLKSGGRFVVSDIYSSAPVPLEYSNDPIAVSECWAGSITKDEYLNILANAGFKNIEILEESDPYPKGKIEVCSFTISAVKKKSCTCSCS